MNARVERIRTLPPLLFGSLLMLTAACDLRGAPEFTIVPGPAGPSPVETRTPFVWETRSELNVWVNNNVTKGPASIELIGDDEAALIRITRRQLSESWVLRGPDFDPPINNVRGLRIRYRWRADLSFSSNYARAINVVGVFEALDPPYPPSQPSSVKTISSADWSVATLEPWSSGPLLTVRYTYFHSTSGHPGELEIDWIELVRN